MVMRREKEEIGQFASKDYTDIADKDSDTEIVDVHFRPFRSRPHIFYIPRAFFIYLLHSFVYFFF